MKKSDFLHVDASLLFKLKVDWNILGEDVVKNGCGHSGITELSMSVSKLKITWKIQQS